MTQEIRRFNYICIVIMFLKYAINSSPKNNNSFISYYWAVIPVGLRTDNTLKMCHKTCFLLSFLPRLGQTFNILDSPLSSMYNYQYMYM